MVRNLAMTGCLRAISSTLLCHEHGATYALDRRHRVHDLAANSPGAIKCWTTWNQMGGMAHGTGTGDGRSSGSARRQIGDDGQPQSRSQPRGVFEVDEDAALDAVILGVPPPAAAGFPGWIIASRYKASRRHSGGRWPASWRRTSSSWATPGSPCGTRSSRPRGKACEGAVMPAPTRPVPAGQHDVPTCLVCGMTARPRIARAARDGITGSARPKPGARAAGGLMAVCARRFPCQARRSRFGWRLTMLRLRRAWQRLRPRPGPSCCGTPGRCSR